MKEQQYFYNLRMAEKMKGKTIDIIIQIEELKFQMTYPGSDKELNELYLAKKEIELKIQQYELSRFCKQVNLDEKDVL